METVGDEKHALTQRTNMIAASGDAKSNTQHGGGEET